MSGNNASADSNNTAPNSSCPICPPDRCLCEVEIKDKDGKTTYYLKSYEALKTEGNERLSNKLFFLSPANFNYKVIGECEHSPNEALDKCVAVYDYEFSEIVDEKHSYSGDEYEIHYNPKIESKIGQYTKGFKFISMEQDDYSIAYKADKKVYISIGESQKIDYFMKKPSGIIEGEVFDFIRGFNLLVLGKITYFPINIHRFGAMTCDPESYKGQSVLTEHYTDLFILPEYEVSFEGEWSFGSEKTDEGESFKIEYEEKTDDKVTRSKEFSYQEVKKSFKAPSSNNSSQSGSTNQAVEGGILTSIFKLIDSFKNMGLISSEDSSGKDRTIADRTKEMLESREMNPEDFRHRIFPPLYRVGLLPPALKIAAKARLTKKDSELLYINRTLDTAPEDPNEDNPKPVSPGGTYNQPNCPGDAARKEAEKEKIPEKITEGKGYLHLDPLIAGYISVNFIAMLTRAPKIGAILGAFNAILDFDMFSRLTGKELKYSSNADREKRLKESDGRAIQVKAFCFLTLNAEASILLKFYDESIEQNGAKLEVRGSIGAGFVLGAAVGVDLWVFQANASVETSYGAEFHFAFDVVSEEIRIWHDQIGLKAEGSATAKGVISTNNSTKGKGEIGGTYQSGDLKVSTDKDSVSGEYNVLSGKYEPKIEEDSWMAAKTYEDTPWIYKFGEDIDDKVIDDSPKGKFLTNVKLVVEFLYQHEGNNSGFFDVDLRSKIEPRLQSTVDKEMGVLKSMDETLDQDDETYIIAAVFTELSAWHEARYSRLMAWPGYQQYYGSMHKSIQRVGRGLGLSTVSRSGNIIFE